MVSETRVSTREDKAVALYELETRFAMAVRQRELLEDYIKERLQPDKHFYTVGDDPGRKPSLTKEGAELICLPHALKGRYHWLSGPENPPLDETPYQITMKCEFEANGKFAGEGVGSASSMVTRKDGTRVQRQKDPGLRHNATIKMACKSAYIAATLNSTAASEFFTQDMEDDQVGTQEKTDTKDHFCKVHNTPFFKRGKMKNYAHPIGDGKEWCNEHTEGKKEPSVERADKDITDLWPEGKPPETTGENPSSPEGKEPPASESKGQASTLESPTEGTESQKKVEDKKIEPEKPKAKRAANDLTGIYLSMKEIDELRDGLGKLQWIAAPDYLCTTYQLAKVEGMKVIDCLRLMDSKQQAEFLFEVKNRLTGQTEKQNSQLF